ncbi:Poly-specific ribonuclease parn, partial [Globisporangium splendens]
MAKTDVHVQEIGRQGFAQALHTLRAVVADCSFVAIDTEMGGLSLQDCRPSMMDSVEERYAQFRTNAQQFPLVQFGLSCFTWDPAARQFDVRNYQFPIFPRFSKIDASELPDRRFLVQPKCLQYIRDHGFDLNQWIDDGISYLSHGEQAQYSHILEKSAQPEVLRKFDPAVPAIITVDTREFLQEITKKIRKRFANHKQQTRKHGKPSHATLRGCSNPKTSDEKREQGECPDDVHVESESGENDTKEESAMQEVEACSNMLSMEVQAAKDFLETALTDHDAAKGSATHRSAFLTEPLAPFRRHVLVQHLEKHLPHVLPFDCKVDNCGEDVQQNPWRRHVRLVATKNAKDKQALLDAYEQIAQQDQRNRNIEMIGFTEVMDLLVMSKKPLVGHNLLLDLMQCFEKFHHPLPSRCAEFLHEMHSWLCGEAGDAGGGGIYDTKEMVTRAMETVDTFANHLQHTALETVFETLSKSPFHGADIRIQRASEVSTASASPSSAKQPKQRVQAHQAGYDAFMTGFVFLRVCCGLGISNETIANLGGRRNLDGCVDTVDTSAGGKEQLLKQFRNCLHVSHFLPAHTLRIPGPYPDDSATPSRESFLRFHLVRTATNGILKTFHIKQCICWALDLKSPKQVHVYWEGKQWVYVSLPSAQLAERLIRIREGTAECEGSAKDPMPSVGCVDIYRCASPPPQAQDEDSVWEKVSAAAQQAEEDDEYEAEKKQAKRRK